MKSAIIATMSKQLVDALLSMNTSNRPIKEPVVDRYASDISKGHWRLTNQGIGVSADGVLIDGQHRLLALKKCGYPPVECVIVRGISADAQRVVDQHAKRSARDIFRLSFDLKIARLTPAILQVLSKFETQHYFGVAKLASNTLSIDDMFDMFQSVGSSIEAVCAVLVKDNHFPAPVLAACVHAHYIGNASAQTIGTFLEMVRVGENLTRKMPAFHLRNYLLGTRSSVGGLTMQQERYLKTSRALDAYIHNEEMGVLRA